MFLDSIELPDDLEWTNEASWSPIAQTTGYSITGSLVINESVKLKGRSIILVGKQDLAWIDRPTLLALIALRDSNVTMTLTLPDAREFSVKFDHAQGALDLSHTKGIDIYSATGLYIVNSIKLIEVSN